MTCKQKLTEQAQCQLQESTKEKHKNKNTTRTRQTKVSKQTVSGNKKARIKGGEMQEQDQDRKEQFSSR